MLRPEQMSKISVTGSRRVMGDVVEAIHDLSLVHLTEYDGGWEGFDQGGSMDGAEEAADKLVTVRSLISQLGVEPSDGGPSRIVTDEALDEELAEVRAAANELDDRREALRDDLRRVTDRIDAVEPFVDVGIDLDLLAGYDSLQVVVGEGERDGRPGDRLPGECPRRVRGVRGRGVSRRVRPAGAVGRPGRVGRRTRRRGVRGRRGAGRRR
ncbi:MAG: hypothetical protein J07HB67_01847 [halophilic archaeon J07HB67]|jgi:Archaeal/vacuolar-type H+-ATPase subunit I|nr:MAG: hypothetical protein J07HB67_01847 [halophilic archaeon J07HB67]